MASFELWRHSLCTEYCKLELEIKQPECFVGVIRQANERRMCQRWTEIYSKWVNHNFIISIHNVIPNSNYVFKLQGKVTVSVVGGVRTHAHVNEIKKKARRRCQWPSVLWRGFAVTRLVGLRVRIPPGIWMAVSCEQCALSRRGACVGPISHLEEVRRPG